MTEMSVPRRSDRELHAHRWRCGLTAALSIGTTAVIWSIDTGAAGTRGPGDPGPSSATASST